MNLLNQFLKEDRKYLNGWSITRDGSPFGDPGDVVLTYNKGKDRMMKIIPYQKNWYFYIEKSEENLKILKRNYPYENQIKIGKEWIRVYYPKIAYSDKVLQKLIIDLERNGVKTYEADISPMKRLCLDFDLKIEDWEKVRVLYFDIETDDSNGKIEIGKEQILSLAGIDQNNREYYISHPDEKVLLNQIKELLMNFDMLIGWNSKDFDMPYLKERFVKHKIKFNYLYNILHEDMMRRVQYFYSKDPEARQSISSYSLNYISNYFLKEGKIDKGERIIDLFKNNPHKLKEYNLQDCKLLKKLEDKLGTIKLTYMMFQWCGVFAQNWSMVKTIDNFILSDANKKGIHYRTNLNQMMEQEESTEESTEFLGAYVLKPIPGYYEDVYDFDFKSLYPNIIRTFNISPDSVSDSKDCIITPIVESEKGMHGGMKYSSEKEGIIPQKIGLLIQQREEVRREMNKYEKNSTEWKNLNVKQLIVKELSNSIYGVLGNKWFRSFSIPLAESITATGQYLIKYVKKINEEEGRRIIYGDTDSIFCILKPKENAEDVLKWINKKIDDHLKKEYRVKNSTIQMELDVKFDKFIIETKKKYVGKIGDNYKFVGMECIKRDSIPVMVNYQKKLIERIMKKENPKSLWGWIDDKKTTVLEEDFKPEDITIRKKLSKSPRLYKGKGERTYTAPLHVRIVLDLISRKNVSEDKKSIQSAGSIIQYIITKGGEGGKAEGIHISEFKGEWDRVYYWNRIIFPPLERLLTVVFPEEKWTDFYIKPEKKTKIKKMPRGIPKNEINKGWIKKGQKINR